jgi:CelD/BcsL family acetyltransferase involved in cellulose biosynthesis
MSANERNDPVAGPFGNLNQAWCSGLDQLTKSYEPTLRNVGRINLELMGLMTRRAQAWLQIPTSASHCKTPQDLFSEQLKFWQAAAQDYTEGARRLSATFASLAGPGFGAAWGKTAVTATPRDYITFPEPKPNASDPPNHDRRAA